MMSAEWQPLGRTLIVIGLVIAAVGLAVSLASKLPWLGRLPGDILVQRERVTFYFPLASSIIISAILSLLVWLWNRSHR